MRKKQRFALPLLLLLTGFGLVVASLCCGSVELTLGEVGAALFGGETSDTARAIVLDYRLPRLLTALTVGASLGLCGLITQTLFENPLADPSLFGIHAGAAVGAAAGPLIWSSGALLFLRTLPPLAGELFGVIMALCGALLVLALIVQLARKQLHGTALLVAGVMISFVLSSVLALMAYFSTTDGLRSFQLWTLGDFSSVGRMRLPLFVHWAYRSPIVGGRRPRSMLGCSAKTMRALWASTRDAVVRVCSLLWAGSPLGRRLSVVRWRSSGWLLLMLHDFCVEHRSIGATYR